MKKKRRLKKNPIIVVMIVASLILLVSIIHIIKWVIDNRNIDDATNLIYNSTKIDDITDSDNTEVIDNNADKSDPYWDYIKMNLINVDFSELKKINDEVKGWIQVNGTSINYPFVKTSDNGFYLTHSIDKSYNDAGWVFMDYRNNDEDYGRNTILYAHGRLNNTMFGSLKNIIKSNWYNDINNHIVKLSTPTENTLWQVFSVYRIPTTNDYIQTDFSTNKEYSDLLTKLKDRSVFTFNTSVSEDDKILTLSTCYNDDEKVVLHAKLIKREKR